MKSLAIGALVDAVRTQTARARERTRVAEWCRHNATIQRGLPALPDGDDTELGLLYAVSQSLSSDGGEGQVAGGVDAGGAASTGGHEAATTGAATTDQQRDANAGGQTAGSGHAAYQRAGVVAAGSAGVDNPGRVGTPWRWAGAALIGAGLLGGGAGLGALLSSWLDEGDETVIVQPGDQSLYQWLEDNGYHLPPNGIPDE